MSIELRPMQGSDATAVLAILQAGMDSDHATFDEQAPSWAVWNERYRTDCRIVAVENNEVCGWCAVMPVSPRPWYTGVVEVSLYVAAGTQGQGVGTRLLQELIPQTEAAGIWTIFTSIFPENTASIAVHKRSGFREIGRREKIAQHRGQWRDTVIMEYRSKRVGIT